MRNVLALTLLLSLAGPAVAEPIHKAFIGTWANDQGSCATDTHNINKTIFLSCKLLAADDPVHDKQRNTVSQLIAMECSPEGKPTTHFADVTLRPNDVLEAAHPRGNGLTAFVRCKGK